MPHASKRKPLLSLLLTVACCWLTPFPLPAAACPQVSFLMNNLTQDNMPSKSKELGNVVIPKYIEWFANYLVVRRAAQV